MSELPLVIEYEEICRYALGILEPERASVVESAAERSVGVRDAISAARELVPALRDPAFAEVPELVFERAAAAFSQRGEQTSDELLASRVLARLVYDDRDARPAVGWRGAMSGMPGTSGTSGRHVQYESPRGVIDLEILTDGSLIRGTCEYGAATIIAADPDGRTLAHTRSAHDGYFEFAAPATNRVRHELMIELVLEPGGVVVVLPVLELD